MRLNDRQGVASIPSRRRRRSVPWRSTTSNCSENFSHSSSRHCRRNEAGVRTRMRWMRRRSNSSVRINPASTVLPRPTSSAMSRLTRGMRSAFRSGTSW